MKASILLLLAGMVVVAACVKKGFDSGKVITSAKNSIKGRWKAEFTTIGPDRQRTYYTPGQILEFDFGAQDSVRYIINDTVKERSTVTFAINDTYSPGNLITTLDMPGVLPRVGIEGIYNDTLGLYVLEPNGIGYYFSRVH
jgi:hypothetical protein